MGVIIHKNIWHWNPDDIIGKITERFRAERDNLINLIRYNETE